MGIFPLVELYKVGDIVSEKGLSFQMETSNLFPEVMNVWISLQWGAMVVESLNSQQRWERMQK